MSATTTGNVQVMLCVNGPDDGSPSGRIEHVHVDDLIQLDGPIDLIEDDVVGATEFAADRYTVAIGGAVFPHKGYSRWVGNWCWDAAKLNPVTFLRLLNFLKRRGWDCTEAESGLFERWRQPGDLTMDDLTRAGLEVDTTTGTGAKGGQGES